MKKKEGATIFPAFFVVYETHSLKNVLRKQKYGDPWPALLSICGATEKKCAFKENSKNKQKVNFY